MALLDALGSLNAIWRGFPFFCEDEGQSGGRRGPLHEYPDRDKPFFEDMGRAADEFQISAYILGDLADLEAKGFEQLLRQGGSGLLVHPSVGRQTVVLRRWHRRKRRDQADYVEYSLTFVEAGQNFWPSASTSWPQTLVNAALLALPLFHKSLLATLLLDGLTQEAAELLTGVGIGLADALDDQALVVSGVAASAALAGAYLLTRDYRSGFTPGMQAGTVAGSTVGLVGSWSDALAGETPDRSSRRRAIDAMMGVYDVAAEPWWFVPSAQTPLQVAETTNQAAMSAAIRRSVLANVARQVASIDFDSYDEAADLRGRLDEAFDREIDAAATDNDARNALEDLSGTVLQAISDMGADKAKLIDYTLPRPMSAFAAAQLFYPDDPDIPARAAELAQRNNAVNPAFLPVRGQRLSK